MRRWMNSVAGHDSASWPFWLLLCTIVLPSTGVVWMMREAMKNERLAVRQRLADAYRVTLQSAGQRVAESFERELERLDVIAQQNPPGLAFARCLQNESADSVIVLSDNGQVVYPVLAEGGAPNPIRMPREWERAERLEFGDNRSAEAAELYATIAHTTSDAQLKSRSQQAQARCLLRIGQRDAALPILQHLCRQDAATDSAGRSLAVDAELRMLELVEPTTPEGAALAQGLQQRLNDYETRPLSADQRRFAMRQLQGLSRGSIRFETLAAEDLAADYLARWRGIPPTGRLLPASSADVWSIVTNSRRVIAIYQSQTLERQIKAALAGELAPEGVTIDVHHGAAEADSTDDSQSLALAPQLAGWSLSLQLADDHFPSHAASERVTLYVWITAVLVGTTLLLATWLARTVRRQLRVARLKNDLVATVSHELKTPLASMRILVDTLLSTDQGVEAAPRHTLAPETREYLELVASENARLTRLIDNFLSFSRMDQGRHQFKFQPLDGRQVIQQAVSAVSDRFDGQRAALTVHANERLPIHGDADALVTAVVNLLDNAWKYSGERKQVSLTAAQRDGQVVIDVRDNGVGMTPKSARRIFDRFFQVNQQLSRTQDGCGLGLSIVQSIMIAHGGRVTVDSQLGQGSTFRLSLPVQSNE